MNQKLYYNIDNNKISEPDFSNYDFLKTFVKIFWLAVLRSRHFFGRLRLRKSEVPLPLRLRPNWVGSGSRQTKGGSRQLRLRLHSLTFFILSS